jgi:hypothetical protein
MLAKIMVYTTSELELQAFVLSSWWRMNTVAQN